MARDRSAIRWGALVAGALLLVPESASADLWGRSSWREGWWLPVGITLGGTFRSEPASSFFLGAELSAPYIWGNDDTAGIWVGPVVDAVWDFGAEQFRHRLGAELGYRLVGVEVAYVGVASANGYGAGSSARGVLTIGVVGLYGGAGMVFGGPLEQRYSEFGGLIKYPFELRH